MSEDYTRPKGRSSRVVGVSYLFTSSSLVPRNSSSHLGDSQTNIYFRTSLDEEGLCTGDYSFLIRFSVWPSESELRGGRHSGEGCDEALVLGLADNLTSKCYLFLYFGAHANPSPRLIFVTYFKGLCVCYCSSLSLGMGFGQKQ